MRKEDTYNKHAHFTHESTLASQMRRELDGIFYCLLNHALCRVVSSLLLNCTGSKPGDCIDGRWQIILKLVAIIYWNILYPVFLAAFAK
jgi:hypothetical protein